ncbi:MAG: hypothetical protein GF313_12820 [Caldithrix sp.]|nr:hypothetical protein [Caldithrix sp.]
MTSMLQNIYWLKKIAKITKLQKIEGCGNNMATIYKKKLLKELESIPSEHHKAIYKIIHLFNTELKLSSSKKEKSSLAGIWKGSAISDNLIKEAEKSLYPYEKE